MSDNFNSIKEFVDDIGGKYAQNIAYRFFRDEVIEDRTYADLKRDAYGLASALVQKGLKSEHIAILGSTSYEWIVSFLAVILSGNVVIPIDKMLLEKEMMFLFSEGDVSAILYDNEFEETAKKAKKEIKKIKNIFDMSSEEFKSLFKTKEEELPITDPEGLCEILFTSGTTGVSKGVMISQKNIISNLKEIHRLDFASNFAGPKVALSVLPVHHTFELTVDNLGILCYGATICINDKIENIAANMNIFKPSVILIVPAIAEALYKKIKDSMADPKTARKIKTGKRLAKAAKVVGMDARRTIFKSLLEKFGGNLCNVVVGGAALRSEIVECFAEFGINVFQGYGLTECAPLVCANCPAEGKIGSVGKPRNVEVKTVNGEIVVKGDHTKFYNEHPPVINNDSIKKIKISKSSSGNTVIKITTKKLLGYKIERVGDQYLVKLDTPKKVFKNILIFDCGHGDFDNGTTNYGMHEKNLNLNMGYTLLKKYFAAANPEVKVYWTRMNDSFVTLDDRSKFAKKVGADAFISLHMNAAPNKKANGTEVYYSTNNNKSSFSGIKSSKMASMMDSALVKALKTDDRGVKSAGFYVIKRNTVPAILVELCFLSGDKDHKRVNTSSFKNTASKTIASVIKKMFKQYPTKR